MPYLYCQDTNTNHLSAQEHYLGGKGLDFSLADRGGRVDISPLFQTPGSGSNNLSSCRGWEWGILKELPHGACSEARPELGKGRVSLTSSGLWVRRKSVPRRSSQLSPSCPSIEKIVLEVSEPCPQLRQCLCVSPCCKLRKLSR